VRDAIEGRSRFSGKERKWAVLKLAGIESRDGGMDTKSIEVRNTFRLLELRRVVCVLSASTGLLLVRIPVLSQGAAGRIWWTVTDQSGAYNARDLTPIQVRMCICQEASVSTYRHRAWQAPILCLCRAAQARCSLGSNSFF